MSSVKAREWWRWRPPPKLILLNIFLFHFICIKIDFHKTQYLDIYYHNFQQMIGFGGSQSGNMFLEKTGTE